MPYYIPSCQNRLQFPTKVNPKQMCLFTKAVKNFGLFWRQMFGTSLFYMCGIIISHLLINLNILNQNTRNFRFFLSTTLYLEKGLSAWQPFFLTMTKGFTGFRFIYLNFMHMYLNILGTLADTILIDSLTIYLIAHPDLCPWR